MHKHISSILYVMTNAKSMLPKKLYNDYYFLELNIFLIVLNILTFISTSFKNLFQTLISLNYTYKF